MKSKCTCKQRIAVNVRDRNYSHEQGCYYVEKLAQEDQERKHRENIQWLYKGVRNTK